MLQRVLMFTLITFSLSPVLFAEEDEPPILVLDTKSFSGADIRSLAFSHDDKMLAIGGGKEVRIWNLENGRLIHTLRGYREPDGFNIGNINGLAFSRNNRYLVIGVTDNTELGSTRIVDLQNANSALQLLPGHTGCTLGAANTPDGRYFATFGCAGKLEVFDVSLAEGKSQLVMDAPMKYELAKREKLENLPDYFGFPFDDDWILLRDRGRQFIGSRKLNQLLGKETEWPARLRRFLTWESRLKPPRTIPDARFTTTAEIRLGAQPAYMRGGEQDGKSTFWVGIWNTTDAEPVLIYSQHRYVPKRVALSSSGKLAASADLLGEIHVWDTRNGLQKLVIRPGNQEFYGVRWINDQTVQISDRFYPQSDYDYNHYGPFTWQLDLTTRRLTSIPATNHGPGERENLRSPRLGAGRLVPNYPKNLLTWSETSEDIALLRKDKLMSYAVLPASNPESEDNRNVVVGTESGALTQQTYVSPQSGDAPVAPSTSRWMTTRIFRGHTGLISAAAVSPNGKLLATSSTDGTVRFWSLDAPRPSGDLPLKVEGNRVESNWAKDTLPIVPGDTLITFDGRSFYERKRRIARGEYRPGQEVPITYRHTLDNGLSELKTALATLEPTPAIDEPLATLFMARDGEWIFWTPAGHYDTSPRGEQFVGWHLNQGRQLPSRFFHVGQFRSRFYHPEIVTERIVASADRTVDPSEAPSAPEPAGNADTPPVPIPRKVVTTFEEPGNLEKILPPEVRILEPSDGFVTKSHTIPVRLEVIAAKDLREQSVSIRVNGRRTTATMDIQQPQATPGSGNLVRTEYHLNLELPARKNQITILAKHDRGESNEARLNIEYQGNAVGVPASRLFFLAIGLDQYQESSLNNSFSASDAKAVEQALLQQKGQQFDSVATKVICNEEVTLANMKEAQDWITTNATQSNDTVIVFVSGRVGFDSRQGWRLLAHDFVEARRNSTSMLLRDMKSWLEEDVVANAILLIDASPEPGTSADQAYGTRPAAWQGTSRIVLTSSMPDEQSRTREEHRVFGQALLEALNAPREADASPADGQLTVEELARFVKQRVTKLTNDQQHPVLYSPESGSDPVLVKYTGS